MLRRWIHSKRCLEHDRVRVVIAVDTNVLARYFLDDEGAEAMAASGLMARQPIFVAKTVLLELEWVLRGAAAQSRSAILKALRHLTRLTHVTLEDRGEVLEAIEQYESGADFADALHLAAARDALGFATFDKKLQKRARAGDWLPPVRPPESFG